MHKNRSSQERKVARDALVKLLNLPDVEFYKKPFVIEEGGISAALDDRRAADAFVAARGFIEKYGPLRPKKPRPVWAKVDQPARTDGQVDPATWHIARYPPVKGDKDFDNPDSLWAEAEVFEYARRFREVWKNAEKKNFKAAEATLNEIFKAGDPIKGEGPVFAADIQASTIRREPRTLLHKLALELLQSRRAVARCLVCKDFFIKAGHQKYCRNPLRDCAHEGRKNKQSRLMRKRRDNAKRDDRKN